MHGATGWPNPPGVGYPYPGARAPRAGAAIPRPVRTRLGSVAQAVSWGSLAALVLDGAADLMSYPDRFTPASLSAELPCLTDLSNDLTETGARGGALGDALPARLTRGELVAQVEAVAGGTGEPGTHGPRAALVRRPRTAEALLGVLAAWSTGRTAVVLTPEAGDDVAAAAIRQEGICEAQPD